MVTCQDRLNITDAVRTRPMTLATTPDRVEVNACWAPITSLFSRLTSAPVWVRVKNASDICCTCWNTLVRMSKIRPSPIREENQRVPSESSASSTASPAMISGQPEHDCDRAVAALISLITSPASSGVATPITDGDDGQQQEDREFLAVRPGERRHPAQRARRELLVQHRAVLMHHPPALALPPGRVMGNLLVPVHNTTRGSPASRSGLRRG